MKMAMSIVSLGLVTLLATTPFAWAQSAGSGSPSGAAGSSSGGAPGTSGTGASGPGASGGTSAPSTAPGSAGGGAIKGDTPSPAASPSGTGAPSASPASGDFMGRHTMTGEVTKVDTQSGKFSLKTDEGTLDLHAPPSALSGVKEGDRLSVEIAVKPMQ